jgi:hypothetical protein
MALSSSKIGNLKDSFVILEFILILLQCMHDFFINFIFLAHEFGTELDFTGVSDHTNCVP